MKKIPIGIDEFKELITNDYFYIDKTKFIEEIINDGAKVKLFTRPRRFGKTLNMSMLKTFFDIRGAEKNSKLFDNLYIKNSPMFIDQGKYSVIFISFKGLTGDTLEKLIESVKIKISKLFAEYRDLIEILNRFDTALFEKMILREDISEAELSESLLTLTDILCRHYKKQVVVLIDEYDAPLTYAYGHGYYKKVVDFLKLYIAMC